MSLYSNEEICKGCVKSIFHDCCGSFCKCKEKHEPNCIEGTCKFKELFIINDNCKLSRLPKYCSIFKYTSIKDCKLCGQHKET